jgi:hypothetical protein
MDATMLPPSFGNIFLPPGNIFPPLRNISASPENISSLFGNV